MRNFNLKEFDSPDLSGSGLNMDKDFLSMLDNARDIAKTPFKITSGYRTKEHNVKVGGVEGRIYRSLFRYIKRQRVYRYRLY